MTMMRILSGLAAALALAAGAVQAGAAAAEPVRARVDSGLLVGAASDGVAVFKGVPFAAPPTGPLRWKPPAPAAPWAGARDATRFGAACPQRPSPDLPAMSEDCLYLNVWTSARHDHMRPMPVMVWIYGGGWRNGHGSDPMFDGATFVRDGVLLVTVNYRLGALGIFAHPALTREAAPDAPLGDYGLMDNIAALQWVKRNIAAFGGDPHRVTVFGESAGGGQVLSLLTVPDARGLFQQAIVESGPAYSGSRTLAEVETSGVALAQHMGLPRDATAAELRAMDAQALVPLATDVAPFVDGRLVKELPQEAFAAGRGAAVPIIIGTNTDEGSLISSYAGPADQVMALYRARGALDALKAVYPDAPDAETLRRQVFADSIFGAPARKIAVEQSARAPVYLYRFGYVRPFRRGHGAGAPHAGDLQYVFDHPGLLNPPATPDDVAMAKLLHGCWISFARTGAPVCPGAPSWPAYSAQSDVLLLFDADGHAEPAAHYHKASFDLIQGVLLDRPAPRSQELIERGPPSAQR